MSLLEYCRNCDHRTPRGSPKGTLVINEHCEECVHRIFDKEVSRRISNLKREMRP